MTRDDSFKISSFCSGGGCLGVAVAGTSVTISDVRNDDGPTVTVSREEWAAFVAGVKNGEFDVD